MSSLTATPLIIETGRGPSIAGQRTNIDVILEHLNSGCSREFIRQHLLLSDKQLDAINGRLPLTENPGELRRIGLRLAIISH